MLTLEEELLDIALEGLANQKVLVDKSKKDIVNIKDSMSKTMSKTAKDLAGLDDKLDAIQSEMPSTVQSEMSKIPIPKNGLDGYNGKDGLKGDTGDIGKTGQVGPQGKQGNKGETGPRGLQGETGKDGKSVVGKPGKHGVDGVGITDVKATHSKMIFTLSDGRVVDVKLPKAKTVPAGVTAMPTEVVVMRNLADTNIDNATDGQVLTKENGKWVGKTIVSGEGDAVGLERRTEIETMFKVAQSTAYKELTYTSGNITSIDIYTNSGKGTKLFSKIIGYNNGNISTISIIDEVNGGTLNKVMAYVEGNISNVTSTYTEVI